MERKETKRKESELTAELTTEVEKNKKEGSKLATAIKTKQATKTKQPKATQAEKPPEEKFLSAKDIAGMAGVTPLALRQTLRKSFAGKISRGEDGKSYQIKASDPVVQEIIAKVKANHEAPATLSANDVPATSTANKGEDSPPSPESPTLLLTESEEALSQEDKGVK